MTNVLQDRVSLWNEADKLFKEKKYDEAIKTYKELASNGEYEACSNLGEIYTILKDSENALKYYKMAADNDILDGVAYMCDYYLENKMYDELISVGEKAGEGIFFSGDCEYFKDVTEKIFLDLTTGYCELKNYDRAKATYNVLHEMTGKRYKDVEKLFMCA